MINKQDNSTLYEIREKEEREGKYFEPKLNYNILEWTNHKWSSHVVAKSEKMTLASAGNLAVFFALT